MARTDIKIRPPGAFYIAYSVSSDRSNPQPLSGAVLTGAVYIFVTPTTGVDNVVWYKDTSDVAYRTDSASPFDLEGDVAGVATVTQANTDLGLGDRQVVAVLNMTNGNCITLSAQFTVQEAVLAVQPTQAPIMRATIGTPTILAAGGPATATPTTVAAAVSIATPAVGTGSTLPIAGDTSNQYVEQRLLTDSNVVWIWNMNNPAGALETIGGSAASAGDSSNNGGSLATIRFFETAPATLNGVTIGNCERLRFPVPSEGGSESTATLTYGEYCRRRFSTLGIPTKRDLYLRYYVYLPSTWQSYGGGKWPALVSIPANQPLSRLSSSSNYYPDSWYAGIMWAKPSGAGTDPDLTRIQCYIYADICNGLTGTQMAANGSGYLIKARAGLNQDETATNAGGSAVTGTGSELHPVRGAWNLIECHVTMNTSGVANGKYRLWLNGVLGINIQNIKWANDTYNATADINTMQFNTFYGGPVGASATQTLYKGEYVMSAARIGARTA